MRKFSLFTVFMVVLASSAVFAQTSDLNRILGNTPVNLQKEDPIDPSSVSVARLHYSGGGDWYWGGSAIPNLLKFVRDNSNFPVDTLEKTIQINENNLFRFPFLFATGHGIIKFTDDEQERLRSYLDNGGFLFINDSYGMDKNLRKEIGLLFPERELVELPFDHNIYHSYYDFPNGPPKIHEHDNKPPQGFAIIIDGRVVLYYLYESDIGDGWEDPAVHDDPPQKRDMALKMGMNILVYALTN